MGRSFHDSVGHVRQFSNNVASLFHILVRVRWHRLQLYTGGVERDVMAGLEQHLAVGFWRISLVQVLRVQQIDGVAVVVLALVDSLLQVVVDQVEALVEGPLQIVVVEVVVAERFDVERILADHVSVFLDVLAAVRVVQWLEQGFGLPLRVAVILLRRFLGDGLGLLVRDRCRGEHNLRWLLLRW